MCASSSTTRIFEVTAIPSIDHPAVSGLSGLRDRNVNSPRGLTSPPCGEVGAGAKRPSGWGHPHLPTLVGRSARARSALPGGGPHLPTLWGGRRGREAPLPGGGADLSLSALSTSFSGFPVNPNRLRTFFSRYRR